MQKELGRAEAIENENKEKREQLATLTADHASLKSERDGMSDLQRRSEEEITRLEKLRITLTERCEAADNRAREAMHSKDNANAEKSRVLQQLAAMTSDRGGQDEAMMRTQTAHRDEKAVLVSRAETAEQTIKELQRERDAYSEERARVNEQMAVHAVERREAEARSIKLEKELAIAQDERGATQVRCDAAEQRYRELEGLRDAAIAERQKLEQEQAVAHAERRRLDEMHSRTEQATKELHKDKLTLQARSDAAEARVRDVLAMRDAMVEERGRALESLATSQAEKEAGEELIRRIELQIRTLNDDKAALLARTDTAEDRAKELTRQRDAAAAERSRLAEQLGVAHTERRAVEEVLRLTEVRIGEERPALLQRAEFAEARCDEMVQQRNELAKEKAGMTQAVSDAKDQQTEAQRELASAVAERRALEELLHRTEQRLGDERAALRAAADGAESRGAELGRQRDEAIVERVRAAEALAASEADRRTAEDNTLKSTAEMKRMGEERTQLLERVGATEERAREMSMQLETAQNALREANESRASLQREKTALAQNLAVCQTELRGKEVVARHSEQRLYEEKLALQARCEASEERCHELSSRRDAMQADRARLQESYNALLDERNRLEERSTALVTEKRGLEELAMYVNAITRGGGPMPAPKSSGGGGNGGGYGTPLRDTPPTSYAADGVPALPATYYGTREGASAPQWPAGNGSGVAAQQHPPQPAAGYPCYQAGTGVYQSGGLPGAHADLPPALAPATLAPPAHANTPQPQTPHGPPDGASSAGDSRDASAPDRMLPQAAQSPSMRPPHPSSVSWAPPPGPPPADGAGGILRHAAAALHALSPASMGHASLSDAALASSASPLDLLDHSRPRRG